MAWWGAWGVRPKADRFHACMQLDDLEADEDRRAAAAAAAVTTTQT